MEGERKAALKNRCRRLVGGRLVAGAAALGLREVGVIELGLKSS